MKSYFFFLFFLVIMGSLSAVPSQIIICRYAEEPGIDNKRADFSDRISFLSDVGEERAQAMKQYLGIERTHFDVLEKGQRIDAIFAVSMPAVQTVCSVADNWQIPIQTYMAFGHEHLSQSTEQLADEIMHNPRYHNKIVLICWEPSYIATDQSFSEKTLRSLLNLEPLFKTFGVPQVWSEEEVNHFWIIQYDVEKNIPIHFKNVP